MEFDSNIHKCVIVIDEGLTLGLAMNALSVIGVSVGRTLEGIVGKDLHTKDEREYPGVIKSPLPILKSSKSVLIAIHELFEEMGDVKLFPFSSLAQSCRTYDEYENKLVGKNSGDIELSGLGIVGIKKSVNKLTGNLPLYK